MLGQLVRHFEDGKEKLHLLIFKAYFEKTNGKLMNMQMLVEQMLICFQNTLPQPQLQLQ